MFDPRPPTWSLSRNCTQTHLRHFFFISHGLWVSLVPDLAPWVQVLGEWAEPKRGIPLCADAQTVTVDLQRHTSPGLALPTRERS